MTQPVTDDAHATAAELHARAAADYAAAQTLREQATAEDRVNGQQGGAA